MKPVPPVVPGEYSLLCMTTRQWSSRLDASFSFLLRGAQWRLRMFVNQLRTWTDVSPDFLHSFFLSLLDGNGDVLCLTIHSVKHP